MSDLEHRITEYLSAGGLFNPELTDHQAVSDLLKDCRSQLAAARAEIERLNENNVSLHKLAFDWMDCHDKLKAGKPYAFPSPVPVSEILKSERDTTYAKGMTEGIKGGRIQMREEAARACEDRGTSYQLSKAPGWQEVVHESDQCAAAIRNLL